MLASTRPGNPARLRCVAEIDTLVLAQPEAGPVGALTARHTNLSDGHWIEVAARIGSALHGFSFAVGARQHLVLSRQRSTCSWVSAATAGRVNQAPEEADRCRS